MRRDKRQLLCAKGFFKPHNALLAAARAEVIIVKARSSRIADYLHVQHIVGIAMKIVLMGCAMPVGNDAVPVKNNSPRNNDAFFFSKPDFYAVACMAENSKKKLFGIRKQNRRLPSA